MGTPRFAEVALLGLIDSTHDICGVFTKPDKPKGRGYKLTASPVKEIALKNNIEVFQPDNLKNSDALRIIEKLNPDIIVVVAYGKILPESIINFPKYGCINVHGSLLPKYRGAAPIQWAVINGDKKTGVTTMYMNEGLDTGDMILKEETDIFENETSGELYERLALLGSSVLIKTIDLILNKEDIRQKQNDDEFTYASMLNKEMALINWNKEAYEIHNLVRGLNPWPIAFSFIDGKRLKIYKTRLSNLKIGKPGEIISLNPLTVACSNNTSIDILEVQYEGKKRITSGDFIRGYKMKKNMKLGE